LNGTNGAGHKKPARKPAKRGAVVEA
jgi:hypothetical protein